MNRSSSSATPDRSLGLVRWTGRRTRQPVRWIALPILVIAAACSDSPLPTQPGTLAAPTVAASLIDPVPICSGGTFMPEAECAELVALYNGTGGDGWRFNDGWGSDPNPCTWFGVTCANGASGPVTELYFYANYIAAPGLPLEFTRFPSLEVLDVRFNDFAGPIPAEIQDLTNLRVLNLEGAGIHGPLPDEIGNLPLLEELDLSQNHDLTGSIPSTIGGLVNLRSLRIYWSGMSGALPPELGDLTFLTYLDLDSNDFSGSLPPQLGGLHELRSMVLGRNSFTGSIPGSFGNLKKLQTLGLSNNEIRGLIPGALTTITGLQALHLDDNQITGPLPEGMAGMTSLERLDLSGNPINTGIPVWMGSLPSLQRLDMAEAGLVGPVPPELGNHGDRLRELILWGNQLTGNLPEELGQLTSVGNFMFIDNPLSGLLSLSVAALDQVGYCALQGTDLLVPDSPEYRALVQAGRDELCGLPFLRYEDVQDGLVDDVEDLVPEVLRGGQGKSLRNKLDNAIYKATDGQYEVAINLITAFINQVENLMADGSLSPEEGQPLVDQAQALVLIWTGML